MINWRKYDYKVNGKKTKRRKYEYQNPSYNIEDIYRVYVDVYGRENKELYLSRDQFKQIVYAYNKIISSFLLAGNSVRLFYRLGELAIKKNKQTYQPDKMMFDYNHFNKTKEITYHLNEKSDEYIARWVWTKINCVVENKNYYSFKPCCTNRAKLAKIMLVPRGHQIFEERHKTKKYLDYKRHLDKLKENDI